MSDQRDLCPMCNGGGHVNHPLSPPDGKFYILVRESTDDDVGHSYSKALGRINELAAKGYELHSFKEDDTGTTWMLQWRYR